MRKCINIGVVGGGFGTSFHFHLHPDSTVVAVSAQLKHEQARLLETYGCSTAYDSLDELLIDPKVDAVAIFTPATLHAQHSVVALNAGKHVLCAVPVGMSLEECQQVKAAVARSGRIYMMAETSFYRQDTISVRKLFEQGDFGRIIAAEADYHHPGLEHYYYDQHGNRTWRYGFPPMKYATHCISFLLGVTKEELLSVSCLGWGDDDPVLKDNVYANRFWNETALFSTSLNTAFKVNVSWKGALVPTERCVWQGEKLSFYSADPRGADATIVRSTTLSGVDDAGFVTTEPVVESYRQPLWWQTDLLPEPLRIPSGHGGAHVFLTHEFVTAIREDREPAIGIREAISYTVPGIMAHQSSAKGGETLKIPRYDNI